MGGETSQDANAHFAPTDVAPLESLFGASSVSPYESARPEPEASAEAEGTLATFMYARLRNFAVTCETMSASELTSFVNEVRRALSSAGLKLGGEIAQRRPDSILCVFSHKPEDRLPVHAKRALHAAILTVHEFVQLATRIAARPQSSALPPLSIAVGVHLGAGEVVPRATNSHGMVHATGEAVEIARLLPIVAADLHWGVVTSLATRQAAGTRVESGRHATFGLPDDTFLEVVEILGLVPRKGSVTPPSHYEALRNSLARNQQLARAAANAAAAANPQAVQGAGHVLIEGYRLLRKIGEGGNATVYLAQPMVGGPTQVLKVLRPDREGEMDLQRFIQEFALLAQTDHPNVARIFRQDFSGGSGYIAMEYFPLGDLRSRMRQALDPGIALYYLKQIAAGLEAIHQVGIVHRDLKPDNVMIRQDGMLAIADFGVAKQVSMEITDTGAGDIIGTPYYLSPEQVLGKPVDARCDLYSLGIVAYEMFTGMKPYHAETARALLDLHVNAPVPALPAALQRFQPVLEKMMAKDPAQRYASATALLDALEELAQ
jgi:class 3 adenylate cyclase/tRNA A-37 threonylcarbamoyl transferase component Bud32